MRKLISWVVLEKWTTYRTSLSPHFCCPRRKNRSFLGKAVFRYGFGFISIAELDGCIRSPAQSDHIKRPPQRNSSSQGSLPWLGFDNKTALIFDLPRIQMDITGNPLESFRIFSYMKINR